MKLFEFINHNKHNSVGLTIINFHTDECYFNNDIGVYKTSVIKDKINDRNIVYIEPCDNSFKVFVEPTADEVRNERK